MMTPPLTPLRSPRLLDYFKKALRCALSLYSMPHDYVTRCRAAPLCAFSRFSAAAAALAPQLLRLLAIFCRRAALYADAPAATLLSAMRH